jgi:hypothetical protein
MADALNIRPYMDALREHSGPWGYRWDTRAGGGRTVQVQCLFRGNLRVAAGLAKAGDRFLRVQLCDDGQHLADHMLVTRDGPVSDQGPRFMRGTTHPTPFSTPAEMLAAIRTEQTRGDHKP